MNTAATGMAAQQLNLDVIANNLANVNTTAFKHQRAEFQDLMYQTITAAGAISSQNQLRPAGLQYGLGASNATVSSNISQGGAQNTNNPLDMMIVGQGFFRVLRPDGSTAYTRDGSFKTNNDGQVVTGDGYPLQPPITVPPGASAVSISPEGFVEAVLPNQTQPTRIEQITLAVFPNPTGLSRIGQNLYSASAASGDEQVTPPGLNGAGEIRAGYLEGSNVSVVEEMVRMITAQRAYEINSKAIQTSDELLSVLNQLKR